MLSGKTRRVLIVVENLPVPLDRRVWLEATTLAAHGYQVSVICPMGRGWDKPYEVIDGVHIYRYPEPPEAHSGALAYAREYLHSLWHLFRLARVVRRERGFDVIHGCNPPDLIFLLALWYRLWGVRYLFDHHDVCPELFEAKFGKRGPALPDHAGLGTDDLCHGVGVDRHQRKLSQDRHPPRPHEARGCLRRPLRAQGRKVRDPPRRSCASARGRPR